ncbi:MAG TPA: CoA transferase [Dehalococcoidia bacterium]|nr:CoA transferase [Dehalococcoidia bacterium]
MQALESVRIADLTAYIAGAYATQLYADLGAQVDKVEPLEGDPFRLNGASWMTWNRGKRSIVLDLKTDLGRQIFYRLVDRSQIVAENFRPGVAERLGVDYQTLKARKPDLIYLRSLAFGSRGPNSELPGFDPIFQSLSGQMASQGGAGQPPVYYKLGVNDYLGAMNAALGGALGLLHQARTGQGQETEGTMIAASIAAQMGEFVWYQGKAERDYGGQEIKGLHPAWRLYQAQDGWVMIACAKEEHWQALQAALGLGDRLATLRLREVADRQANDYAISHLLASAVRGWTVDALIESLERAGVPASPNSTIPDLFEDPHVLENELAVPIMHPRYGIIEQPGVMMKFSETPGRADKPAPMLGEHTVEILAELQYTPEEIETFLAEGIAGQYGVNVETAWGSG